MVNGKFLQVLQKRLRLPLVAGTLGVITEVSLKIRPIPPVRKYASFVFPDFDFGVRFMRQVAREVILD